MCGVINRLFAIGLDLAATATLVDGVVAARLDGAIHSLDDVIADLRTDACGVALPGATTSGSTPTPIASP